MSKVLYRATFENTNDYAENWAEQEIVIKFDEYPIIKETDKTYTITVGNKYKKVVLKDQSGKRFAYETKNRALDAFVIRRNSYARHLRILSKYNERLVEIAKNTELTNE